MSRHWWAFCLIRLCRRRRSPTDPRLCPPRPPPSSGGPLFRIPTCTPLLSILRTWSPLSAPPSLRLRPCLLLRSHPLLLPSLPVPIQRHEQLLVSFCCSGSPTGGGYQERLEIPAQGVRALPKEIASHPAILSITKYLPIWLGWRRPLQAPHALLLPSIFDL